MENDEIMENEEIVDKTVEIEEDIENDINPMVVAGAFAAGVAALGFGKFVVYDKLLKPGAAKAKSKLVNAKEEYQARKAAKSKEITLSKPVDVINVKESEEE